ncbi:MAG TPA: tRNA (adenosine(37)-N6)-threonylcarbamoyltransferase complex ATPase subunit type 1 TsaE [Nocardiopsis listeri]|uniref:tRNA (adenosine(37)-N6)-threonylcarbamoyltransferase complex ATPase subunit type 1 TsaE n=1 Tax=Nocardiopsis listeri TaxID=53440 RepID=UPI001D6D63FE|nr:tRNA (adenosine(37)-N6)-threonylcarbamoyltransferase complex ATPase subunit type 1 TsaE [Nocardiopsis listeri]HJE60536.1 tRNA (adenosine(37)-N6)-threonylcarbamoyltransferase complex ATPase subunit type 1 TsaE [Nocardiopsis listeri]
MTNTTATTDGVPHVHAVTAATDDAMRALGRDLAALTRPGDLLILSGPLGAGKTTFTQGLGQGLDVRGSVTSPTFVISRIHPSLSGGPALVHVDAYRLGGSDEIDDIDLDMTLPESVTVVEWGEGVAEGLADDRLEIRIERHPDDTRTVHLRPVGARWTDIELPGTTAGRG